MAPKLNVCKKPAGAAKVVLNKPRSLKRTLDSPQDRSILASFFKRCIGKLDKAQLARLRGSGTMTMSSACSGSGIAEVVHSTCHDVLRLKGVKLSIPSHARRYHGREVFWLKLSIRVASRVVCLA